MSQDETMFDRILEVLAERFALLDDSSDPGGLELDGDELLTELLSGRN